MREECQYLGCRSYGIWKDVDTGKVYCGAHSCIVIDGIADQRDREDRRRDIGDEWERDAAREAREQ